MTLNVGIICGGQSPEHEISILSAKNVLNALNKDKYAPEVIYIEKNGRWKYAGKSMDNLTSALPELCILPGNKSASIAFKDQSQNNLHLDIVFPVLHGQQGEDGTIQGLLQLCNLPFVGCGVLGSAISMDKEVIKRILRDANIAIPKFLVFHQHEMNRIHYEDIVNQLGSPFFIKPTNAGSSIGINKVKNASEFQYAIDEAFRYDQKIIIEESINCREIECAVLGNESPQVALPGEIIPHHEFYTYNAKYVDDNGATVVVPADLDKEIIKQFQDISIKVFRALCCKGMVRVDFLYAHDGRILVNEINSIPGFTNISMYPKCWIASGMSYADLIERLITLGLSATHYAMVN